MRRTWLGFSLLETLAAGAEGQNNKCCVSCAPANCGFATFNDCPNEIRGKTGLCDYNPQFERLQFAGQVGNPG